MVLTGGIPTAWGQIITARGPSQPTEAQMLSATLIIELPPPFLESNHPLSSFPVQFWCFCRNQRLPTAKKSQPQKCKAQAYPVELSIWESTSTGGLCSWTEVRHGWAWRITVVGNLLTIVRLTRQLEGETNQMTTALRSSRISNLKKKGAFLLI